MTATILCINNSGFEIPQHDLDEILRLYSSETAPRVVWTAPETPAELLRDLGASGKVAAIVLPPVTHAGFSPMLGHVLSAKLPPDIAIFGLRRPEATMHAFRIHKTWK